jgi:hypothetical protein
MGYANAAQIGCQEMIELITPFMGYIFALLAGLSTLALAWFGGSQSRKNKELVEQLKKTINGANDAKKRRESIGAAGDDELIKRVRDSEQ